MKTPFVTTLAPLALLAILSLGACKSSSTQSEVPAAPAEQTGQNEDDGAKRAALERKIAITELKLSQAKLDQDAQAKSSQKAVDFAQEELEMAQAKQAQYETLDAPNRKARGELDLKRAEDRTAEAAEELKQLEIMYDEQDLEDMTAEFVISRGRRNAERAEMSLAIQRKELEALTAHEMPREQRALQLAVARQTTALEKAKADAESSRIKHEIAVKSAESDLTELREKLEKMAEDAE